MTFMLFQDSIFCKEQPNETVEKPIVEIPVCQGPSMDSLRFLSLCQGQISAPKTWILPIL
ncbi:MAG: hypothetical protein HFACDABA_02636 [Anaerolineales bacterium]|nr:hypothetical protein [Anaerolineales bacterium]